MQSPHGRIPNFFIVGAPKAGTTSLYAYLEQHPQIYMSPLKETYYFASEVRVENFSADERARVTREAHGLAQYLRGDMRTKRFGAVVSSWDDYLKLFQQARDEIAIGEATPHYLWSETAARNIAARIPHARIIISLRNPVDRAFSNYLHMLTAGATRRSFREQIDANLRCTDKKFGLDWPFLEFGQYTQQIQRYLEQFPRTQIHISLYEDLEGAPERLMSDLFAFLGVDRDFGTNVSRRHNQPAIPKSAAAAYAMKLPLLPRMVKIVPAPMRQRLRSLLLRSRASLAMDPTDRAFLTDYYREEIGKLAALLDRDLSGWLR
jgi:hypothetical protein